MSIQTTKPALDEEADLRQHVEHFLVVARDLSSMTVPERIDVAERIAAFLADMLQYASAQQRVLYPQAARLLHVRDDSDDVGDDRAAVRKLLARLARADATDSGELQEVLYALYTLLSAHFWREEALFVRLAAEPDEGGVRRVVSAAVAASA